MAEGGVRPAIRTAVRTLSVTSCVICCHESEQWCLGECNHPVCLECSIRIRALSVSEDAAKECPICRKELKELLVVPSDKADSYQEWSGRPLLRSKQGDKLQIKFQSEEGRVMFSDLLAHVCTVCPNQPEFLSFDQLRTHMKREHQLFYCDLCATHLLLFSWERKCYNRQELARHRREGDPEDKSHRGHPACKFCDQRFLDNDHLYRHLRRDHYLCHFCESDSGAVTVFYNSYPELKEHFRQEHYLCEDGQCRFEQFTHAFRYEVDLKAHKATAHKGKDRVLNLDWGGGRSELPPGPQYGRGERGGFRGRGRGRGGRGEERERDRPKPTRLRTSPEEEEDDHELVVVESQAGGGGKINTVIKVKKDRRSPNEAESSQEGIQRPDPKSPEFQAHDFPSLGGARPKRATGAFSSDGFSNFAGWSGRSLPPGMTANTNDFPSLHPDRSKAQAQVDRPKLEAQVSKVEEGKGGRKGLVMIDDDDAFPSLAPAPAPTPAPPKAPRPAAASASANTGTSAAMPSAQRTASPVPEPESEAAKPSLYQSLTSGAWGLSKPASLGQVSSILTNREEFPSLGGSSQKIRGQRQANANKKVNSVWKVTAPANPPSENANKKKSPRAEAPTNSTKQQVLAETNWIKTTAKKSELQKQLEEEEIKKKKEAERRKQGELVKVGSGVKSKPEGSPRRNRGQVWKHLMRKSLLQKRNLIVHLRENPKSHQTSPH